MSDIESEDEDLFARAAPHSGNPIAPAIVPARASDAIPSEEELLKFDYLLQANEVKHRSDLPPMVDLVIEVVNANEWCTALHFLTIEHVYTMPKGGKCYAGFFKKLGQKSGKVILVQSVGQGSFHSASLLEDVLQLFRTRVVLGVGCAFGFDRKLASKSDVMVSKLIAGYESMRMGSDAKENRNKPIQMNTQLEQAFFHLQKAWALNVKHSAALFQAVTVRLGAVLCGEKLVDDAVFKASIADHVSSKHVGDKKQPMLEGEAILGGEMEGTGLGVVCAKYRNLPCAIVKGISDFGALKNALPSAGLEAPVAVPASPIPVKSEADTDAETATAAKLKKIDQRSASYAAFHLVQALVADASFHKIKHFEPASQVVQPSLVSLDPSHHLYNSATKFINAEVALRKRQLKLKESLQDTQSNTPSALLEATSCSLVATEAPSSSAPATPAKKRKQVEKSDSLVAGASGSSEAIEIDTGSSEVITIDTPDPLPDVGWINLEGSGVFDKYHWNPISTHLTLSFKSGACKTYKISLEMFERFKAAQSKGSFYHEYFCQKKVKQ